MVQRHELMDAQRVRIEGLLPGGQAGRPETFGGGQPAVRQPGSPGGSVSV